MSVDSNYNSQFIQVDFRLLDNPAFLKFVNRTEFATYLILRRYIWRGGEHRLGLHDLYAKQNKLASSVGAKRIAEMLGFKDATRISKHLTYLENLGVLRRIHTGRETISILGEWHQPPGWDVSKEFYYLENRFGLVDTPAKPDLAQRAKPVLAEAAKSDLQHQPSQNWPDQPSSNREENREVNTVRNGVKELPDLGLSKEQQQYIAEEILDRLGDQHSRRFYELVAAKVPETVIRQALSEIKADGAKKPAKVFTYRMNQYVIRRLSKGIGE